MNETTGRALLYGGAVLGLATLAAVTMNATDEADALTLLSSADVQLRTAYAIPEFDKQGKRLDSRDALIDSAVEQLEAVDRLEPGMACTAEFRGFAHMLRGRYADAARCYGEARRCGDVGDEQRDVLTFNQARMLVEAGRYQAAIDVFGGAAAALDARYGHQRRLEEAAILRRMGRVEDAAERLRTVTDDDDADAMASLQAGREYARLGLVDAAEAALQRSRDELPIADYYLAQLKLQSGQTDSSIELLVRVHEARPAEVRRLLREEADAWSAVAEDVRVKELSESMPASPGR